METSNRELQAAEYLERHRIKELVSYLTSALLFFRPKTPRVYAPEDEDLKDDEERVMFIFNKRMKEIWSAF
uniref:Uncharacterized protein n=1 Tax=Macaca nemestrina TaxID=9545 RepID=A0A2K6B7H9_MACNE